MKQSVKNAFSSPESYLLTHLWQWKIKVYMSLTKEQKQGFIRNKFSLKSISDSGKYKVYVFQTELRLDVHVFACLSYLLELCPLMQNLAQVCCVTPVWLSCTQQSSA